MRALQACNSGRHWPISGIEIPCMKRQFLAIMGGTRPAQLLCSCPHPLTASALTHGLCSVAALYLVERLKSEVMAAAATHFQALAVGQARRRTIKRLARHPPGHRKAMHVRPGPQAV